uniref:Cytochrome P450 n=2 Tax=Timema shepardi TaxID=629360 RepID=A0A7R9G2A9_TIMSH|nr:unnamed protein product [Timema shepardi]
MFTFLTDSVNSNSLSIAQQTPKMVWFVLGFVAIFLIAVYAYNRFIYTYWWRQGIPYISSSVPFGNFWNVIIQRECFAEGYRAIYDRCTGPWVGFFLLHKPVLMVKDPELIRTILMKNFANFQDRGMYVDEKNDPLSAHLFSLSGQKWRKLRAQLTSTFSSGKLKRMTPIMVSCTEELNLHLQECEDVVELKEILASFSTDVIASCAFGIQCNSLRDPNAEFRKWGRKMFEPGPENTFRSILCFLYPSVASILRVRSMVSGVTEFFQTVVRETIEYRETKNISRPDFMQLLIQLKNHGELQDDEPDKQTLLSTDKTNPGCQPIKILFDIVGLTENEVTAQAFVFFFAGFETSSTTINFCLYELAMNQDIQARLRKDISLVLDQHDGKISYEAVQSMEYLDRVVAETLRKYPPLGWLNRECTNSFALPGTPCILEKGTGIVISLLGLHRDPRYYPDPDRFDPERFTEENKKSRPHCTYMPFGEGPRICIVFVFPGLRFGLLQTKMALASLVHLYKFRPCPQTLDPMVFDTKSFFLAAKGGMYLQTTRVNRT